MSVDDGKEKEINETYFIDCIISIRKILATIFLFLSSF
jgi:hypothetical protein